MKSASVQTVPLNKLRQNKRNVRTHSKKQIEQIVSSFRQFGYASPIIVDEQYVILAGHGRYLAAQQLKLKELEIRVLSGLTETEKRAYALADNKIAANAGWDRPLLAAELHDLAELLPQHGILLGDLGFTEAEHESLLGDLIDPEQDPADVIKLSAATPVSRVGDLFVLGGHRLLCGDARKPAHYRKLMFRQTAAMVFTDPPYNQRIRDIQGRGAIKHAEFVEASGDMSSVEFVGFLHDALELIAQHSAEGSIHYLCMDWRHSRELQQAADGVFSEQKNLVVWVKSNAGQGTFYRSQHELILVFKKGDKAHINNFELGQHGRYRSNVWSYPGANTFRAGRMEELAMHPTVKPVALVSDAMRDCSRRGDIVLDPFMGSGTTILAAERVGRRAYGMEIEPRYVDTAVRRWQAFTGKDAVLENTGQTFDELEKARVLRGLPK